MACLAAAAGQEVPEGLGDGRHRHRRHRHRQRTRTEEDSARVQRWRRDKERWQRFWARAQPREAPRRTGKLARLANLLRLGEGAPLERTLTLKLGSLALGLLGVGDAAVDGHNCWAWTWLGHMLDRSPMKGNFAFHVGCKHSFQASDCVTLQHSVTSMRESCTQVLAEGMQGSTLFTLTDIPFRLRQRSAG